MRARSVGNRRDSNLGLSFLSTLLLIASLPQITSKGLRAQSYNGLISGRVAVSHGEAPRVLVHLLAEGDVPAGVAFTDSSGAFAFRGLPSGTYYVVVEAPGYRPARERAVLEEVIEPKAQVNLFLEPAEKERKPPGQIIAGSAKSYAFDAKNPSRPFDRKAVRAFEKGNEQQQQGHLGGAIAQYQKALRIEPDFYPALNNFAVLLERKGDHAQAESMLLKSLHINPDDAEAYINLGHVFYEEQKYSLAVDRLEEGLRRSPRSPVGHFFLGSAYLRLGDLERAERNLKEALLLDPSGIAPAHLQLANLYLKRRDTNAASAQLESYLQAKPSDPQAPAIKKMLANMQAHPTN